MISNAIMNTRDFQPTPRATGAALIVAAMLVLSACSDSGSSNSTPSGTSDSNPNNTNADNPNTGGTEVPDEGSNPQGSDTSPAETEATYRLTFNASWSASSHPLLFPSNPHFSGLVGALHNDQVIVWEPGQIASPGIEQMAESGSKNLLREELNAAIDAGYAQTLIDEGGIATSPDSRSIEFTVSIDNPLLTLVTMLAPSPDWFVGVHGLALHDGESFLEQTSVTLKLYDAGTDSGTQYRSGNDDTQPRSIIELLTSDAADSPFVNGEPAVGEFMIEKL